MERFGHENRTLECSGILKSIFKFTSVFLMVNQTDHFIVCFPSERKTRGQERFSFFIPFPQKRKY